MMVDPDSERGGRVRGTREVKAEEVQANDSHRRVAQQEILEIMTGEIHGYGPMVYILRQV
jgi:hypothetical protein